MDFIERWLGLAPDSAGRVVELLILIVLTSVIVGLILYFFRDDDLYVNRAEADAIPKRRKHEIAPALANAQTRV